jgi:hypothetical protein
MDYLEMVAFACIFLGCSLLIGVAAYKLHGWWLRREERRSLAAIQQMEDDEYAGLRASLLSHVDELIRKVDRQ